MAAAVATPPRMPAADHIPFQSQSQPSSGGGVGVWVFVVAGAGILMMALAGVLYFTK